jgi:3-oxoadipate enol-lactonase
MDAAQPIVELVPPTPRIAVEHKGTGPFCIFLHGIGGNRTFWREQVTALSSQFHAAAWDTRGYGASDDYEGPGNVRDFAADLRRVLDYFKVKKAHVVGLSMGGIVAMAFCKHYPERIATLTIADTSEGFVGVPESKRAEFMRQRQQPLLEGKSLKDIAPDVAKTLMIENHTESSYQTIYDGVLALHKESFLKTIEAVARVENLEIDKIRVPTHVICGAEDTSTPIATNQALAGKIKGSEFTVVPRAGHISNVDQPEAFSKALMGFLLKYRDVG